jgi:pimeloyl-ACP methyl ester carboxylesterase
VRGGVVEDAGHWIPEEKPEWATQEILKFFEG